jgi:hypothetical protein
MKPAVLIEKPPVDVKSPAKLTAGRQLVLSFFEPSPTGEHFAQASEEERGAVFTQREVVDFILDLAGYTVDRPLHRFRLLEPAFGRGDFLLPVVERLLAAYGAQAPDRSRLVEELSGALRAVEVHRASIEKTRAKLCQAFRVHGVSDEDARRLLDAWIVEGDFLLADLPETFTHAVGNPPYVRQELIPDGLMAEYRARYRTIYDRADLYVPFIERSLDSLAKGGTLAFICADRWMKNKYGGPLRAMVAEGYHLAGYVDMTDTPAFHSEVSAYPAITVIRREKAGPTRIAHRPPITREALAELARAMRAEPCLEQGGAVEVADIVRGSEPWLLQSFDQLAVVRRLEEEFPLLEEAGCKVGIGVASGADRVFIGPFHGLDVEPDRKLPLATTRDIEDGTVRWTGQGIVNPFLSDGSLVDLGDYPKLARYLERHGDIIRRRNCAKRNPGGWYRTIDRIYTELTYRPKLLIPDIKGEAHVVYEEGRLYPHHNLYFITSDTWDLKALQAVLRSGIAKLFVSMYSTRMRGGYLRFQAQYLRRIRLPRWHEVPAAVQKALTEAANAGDAEACNRAAFALYRLTPEERAALGGNGH